MCFPRFSQRLEIVGISKRFGEFALLDQTFNGSPQTLRTAISLMYRLKVQAQALMEMPPTEDGITTAGPTFEYVPPGR